ncbi:hypothetical protein [Streptococcus hyointestinalis]|nr:hypothetical protein [Streptococcus hyointestinalis]
MKKNLIKSLTLSTATLAAFSLANTVLADETTTTSTPEQASQVIRPTHKSLKNKWLKLKLQLLQQKAILSNLNKH